MTIRETLRFENQPTLLSRERHKIYMKSLLVLVIAAVFVRTSEALSKAQPWPVKMERTGACCLHSRPDYRAIDHFNFAEVQGLRTCLNKQRSLFINSSDVSIVTFSSSGAGPHSIPDIDEFAVYQRALVSAYAENKRYVYRHVALGIDDASFDAVQDARWFKVKILLDALDGWANETTWILWIDADAVVLDFGLDVEELGRRHPLADVLASADIRMGLVNTGTLLLRNTPWLRDFLRQWWYGPGGSMGNTAASELWRSVCDQDAFDRLYSHYSATWREGMPRISDKVKVLPMDAINSHPPAVVHQRAENAVLHLMGEDTAMRRELFRRAWGTVCAARSGGVLAPQLGLNKNILLLYARSIYSQATDALLSSARNMSVGSAAKKAFAASDETVSDQLDDVEENRLLAGLVQPLEALSRTAHHLCDVLRHLHLHHPVEGEGAPAVISAQYQSEALRLREDIFDIVSHRAEEARTFVANLTTSILSTRAKLEALESVDRDSSNAADDYDRAGVSLVLEAASNARKRRSMMSVHVQLLKRAAEAGNDLFGAEPRPIEKLRVATAVLSILDDLEGLVDERSRCVPMHMRALMHHSLGVLEQSRAAEAARSEKVSIFDTSAVHLQEAYKHALASATIFSAIRNMSHIHVEDSSSLMEVSASLQLLAGVTCSLGRSLEARRRWEEAVDHARGSLRGIHRGVRFDNLAVALYNAAVCFNVTGNAADADILLSEAMTIIETSAERVIAFPEPAHETHHTLRSKVQQLRADILGTSAPPTALQSRELNANSGRGLTLDREQQAAVMRPVIDPVTGKVSYVRKATALGGGSDAASGTTSPQQLEQQEHEEWEECEMGEPCEEFVVEVGGGEGDGKGNGFPTLRSLSSAPPAAPTQTHDGTIALELAQVEEDPLAGLDLVGMTPEEVAELKEVRGRYARQQRKQLGVYAPSSASPNSAAARDPLLASLVDQVGALRAMHAQQGRIIEQMLSQIEALQKSA